MRYRITRYAAFRKVVRVEAADENAALEKADEVNAEWVFMYEKDEVEVENDGDGKNKTETGG